MSQTKIEIQREMLQDILSSIEGVQKVYFQPPEKRMFEYPCIVYELNELNTMYSNNTRYLTFPKYTVTLIDKNPESPIQQLLLDLGQGCRVSFDRFFTLDGLNHWVYSLIFTKGLW